MGLSFPSLSVPWQLLANTVIYAAITVCGFLISIPLGITKADFGGYCVLYMGVNWKDENHFEAEFSNESTCDFTIYLPVVVCILQGVFLTGYHGYAFVKTMQNKDQIVRLTCVTPWLCVNVIVTCLMFVASCILSVGISHTCSQLLANPRYTRCTDFQRNMVWTNPLGKKIDSGTFYKNIRLAQSASWMCTVLWAVVVVLLAYRFVRLRYQRPRVLTISASSSQEKTIVADLSPTTA